MLLASALAFIELAVAHGHALRGPAPAKGVLLATKDTAISANEDEDGAASAEAIVAEAEQGAAKEEAQFEATDNGAGDAATAKEEGAEDAKAKALATAGPGKESTKAKAVPRSHNEAALVNEATKPKAAKKMSKAAARRARRGPRNIKVTIVGARGLKGEDGLPLGVSDPYCICKVEGKKKAKVQTMAIDGINGVHWEHEGEIQNFLARDSLSCSVYEQDGLPGQNFLGKTTLKGKTILPKGFDGELPLQQTGKDSGAYLKLVVVPMAISDTDASDATDDAEDDDEDDDDSEGEDSDSDDDDSEEDDVNGKNHLAETGGISAAPRLFAAPAKL